MCSIKRKFLSRQATGFSFYLQKVSTNFTFYFLICMFTLLRNERNFNFTWICHPHKIHNKLARLQVAKLLKVHKSIDITFLLSFNFLFHMLDELFMEEILPWFTHQSTIEPCNHSPNAHSCEKSIKKSLTWKRHFRKSNKTVCAANLFVVSWYLAKELR